MIDEAQRGLLFPRAWWPELAAGAAPGLLADRNARPDAGTAAGDSGAAGRNHPAVGLRIRSDLSANRPGTAVNSALASGRSGRTHGDICGQAAQVTYAGMTIAGAYQINATVPTDLADGINEVAATVN